MRQDNDALIEKALTIFVSVLFFVLLLFPVKSDASQTAKVLTVGDSIAQGYGLAINQWFRGSQWELVNGGVVSSGLASEKRFDWINGIPTAVAHYRPNVVLISIGANDARDMNLDGRLLRFGTTEWDWEYARRSCYFGAVASATGATVIWMPTPPAKNSSYNSAMFRINSIHEMCAKRTGARWTDLPPQIGRVDLAEKGFLRSKDGLHLSSQGYRLGGEWALRVGLSN